MTLTTGVAAIDDLLDQVRVGDNLVFVSTRGVDGAWLVDSFIAAAETNQLVIIDASGRHAAQEAAVVLDWTPSDVIDAGTARTQLAEVDAALGTGAFYVIDSLAPLTSTWGDQASLDLFLWACPRLFSRQSVALWLVERDHHDEAFLRRLTEITQVVVDVATTVEGTVRLEVLKADGRPSTVVGRTLQLGIEGGEVGTVGHVVVEQRRFGQMLRDLRASHGVGQAELARRSGISPSALSQAERGVRSISADTLMRIYEALGVVGTDAARGYTVSRRGTRTGTGIGPGVTGRKLVDGGVTAWHLTVDPRAAGRQSMFAVKGAEVVIVVQGVFDVEVGGQRETLHAGDALQATSAAISEWRNPADTPAELIWVIGS